MKNKFKILIIFSIITLLGCQSKLLVDGPRAVKGIFDTKSIQFSDNTIVPLDGEWKFYWNEFLYPQDFKDNKLLESAIKFKEDFIPIPQFWNQNEDKDEYTPFGYGTVCLKVKNVKANSLYGLYISEASSSAAIYVDGQLRATSGRVGKSKKEYTPRKMSKTIYFKPGDTEFDIILHISNFSDINGGIETSITFGTNTAIQRNHNEKVALEFFLFGSIIIMGIYHFSLYFLRRKDIGNLFFAIFCFLISIRTLMTGQRFIHQWLSSIPFEVLISLEFLTVYGPSSAFLLYFKTLFPKEWNKYINYPFLCISGISALVAIFLPVYSIATYNIYYNYIALFPICLSIIFYTIVAIVRKREGARTFLLGFLVLFITVTNDILFSTGVIRTGFLLPYGLFVFIFAQSYLLSRKSAIAFNTIENFSKELESINISYARFVPKQFLQLLGKESIIKVNRGDQIEMELTILFCDIRAFSSLSEKMTPRENFNFLNSYLEEITPTIRKYNGFIDKYIGDEVMALFPENPEDGVKAALELNDIVKNYNKKRRRAGYDPISIGIGVHTGIMMLGTIGDENRMEGTVISDAVNLASRLEGLTKLYGGSTIISSAMLLSLKDPNKYYFRFLGLVRVKGKQETLPIYELIQNNSENTKKIKTKDIFELSVQSYLQKHFNEAEKGFNSVLEDNPSDIAAEHYLYLTQKHRENGGEADLIEQINNI
jgi:class 3 adenylate cyclase